MRTAQLQCRVTHFVSALIELSGIHLPANDRVFRLIVRAWVGPSFLGGISHHTNYDSCRPFLFYLGGGCEVSSMLRR